MFLLNESDHLKGNIENDVVGFTGFYSTSTKCPESIPAAHAFVMKGLR